MDGRHTDPDFTLSYDPSTPTLPLAAVPGGSSPELGVVVDRLFGSSGPLSVTVSKLPVGVVLHVVKDVQTDPTRLALRLGTQPFAKPALGTVVLTVTPDTVSSGQVSRSLVIPFAIVESYDLAVTGIEITQGIQRVWSPESALPARNPDAPTKPIAYPDGIGLAACAGTPIAFPTCLAPSAGAATIVRGKRTAVRVFAISASPTTAGLGPGKATMLLHGRSMGGGALPGSPLQATNLTAIEGGDPLVVPLATLLSSKGVFQFSLPSSWTKVAKLELEAELAPLALYGTAECSSAACATNNRLTLTSIEPRNTGFLNVWNIGFLNHKSNTALLPTVAVYKPVRTLLPLADGELRTAPYRAFVDATALFGALTIKDLVPEPTCMTLCDVTSEDALTRLRDKMLIELVDDYAHPAGCGFPGGAIGDPASCPDLVMGVAPARSYGLSRGKIVYRIPISVVNQQRPLTSVGHELVHGLGARHADHACGGSDGGQESEPWWPDWWGQIAGIGLGTAPTDGLFPVVYPGPGPKAKGDPDLRVYDFMSYCANDGKNGWISTINWERAATWLMSLHGPSAKRRPSPALVLANEPILLVRAFVLDDGVVVTTARPTLGTALVGPPDSAYRVVLRGQRGEVLVEAPLLVGVGDAHGGSSDVQLEALVPLPSVDGSRLPPGLRTLEVVRDGVVVASVARARSRPRVIVRAPTRDSRIGGAGKTVRVLWTAEAPGSVALRARVEYSGDGGATWRQVWTGPGDGSAALPGGALPASDDARLRVAVSDGLDETISMSDRFVSLGSPPQVEIESPAAGETVGSGVPVTLEGVAWEDDGGRIAERAIAWWTGGRRIAVGGSTSAVLPVGTHLLKAVARDARGREGAARVRVRVVARDPVLLVRRAPAQVSRRASSVSLRLATTVPAIATAKGAHVARVTRFTLTRQARLVRVPVRPGAAPLVIRVSTFAAGRRSTVSLTIARDR